MLLRDHHFSISIHRTKQLFIFSVLVLLTGLCAQGVTHAATPGLPFVEDFADTTLRDAGKTNASWSTDEQALILAWRQAQSNIFPTGASGTDITPDTHGTVSIALGDMDGDGDLDVVAGNWGNNRLYLNNGSAVPFAGVSGSDISADAHTTQSIALGDVDGDGDLDVVAGNNGQATRLYLNDGSADPFNGVSGSDISTDAHVTFSIALGDVDGDGDLDVVAGNNGQANRLYLNDGSADPFDGVIGTNISSDAHNTTSIALGDMDSDGDLDLVAGAGNDVQANRLYLNNGTTDPFNGVSGTNISDDAYGTNSIALGDVDGDGDLDVVAGNLFIFYSNRLYLNNGTADPFNGVSGTDIGTDYRSTWSIALGDVDGDGDLDVVAGNDTVSDDANRLYLNDGSANPFVGDIGSDITPDAHTTLSIALGDVDGDGDLDVVAGHNVANRLYLNNTDPFAGVSGSDISADVQYTNSIALGDVDSDGDLDVVAGNVNDPAQNRLYLNNGTADPFVGVIGSDISSDAHSTYAIALGDMDGDGDLDVVAGNNGRNRLYLNNGTADPFNGVSGSDISTDADATPSITLGDMDGDGDLDVVAGSNGRNRLYLNNGTTDPFNGVSGSDISTDEQYTRSIALGDMDGDGDLDVVAGNGYSGQTNRLYLNNGTADPFNGVSGSDISTDAHRTFSIALGDMDGDGDLDVVAGNVVTTSTGEINRLYLNNGTADPFAGVSGSNISTDAHTTYAIALGDVDGDGDLDVVAGNLRLSPDITFNRLYLNNGTANPFAGVSGSDIGPINHNTASIVLGDVDGDGDLDVVAGNVPGPGTNHLYLNQGGLQGGTAGSYTEGTDISADADNTASIVLGDVDGDGDVDVVVGNTGEANQLYLNNGTTDPFVGVSGSDISTDAHDTMSIALGDVDGDGNLDVVAGNNAQVNRLYLNNGTADPFNGVSGSDISSDTQDTTSIALDDVDGDGDLDVVAGNSAQVNRLYLNNDTADPFNGVSGSDISTDAHVTQSIVLGDVDGDGDLDVVAGNNAQVNRLYLNNDTADPFNGVSGSDIGSDTQDTTSITVGDVDGDGDVDVVAGNAGEANRLYLNNGTADPFNGVSGSDISSDTQDTTSIALDDVDGDGDLDVVTGNSAQANRLYLNQGGLQASTAGSFTVGTNITFDVDATQSIALGDVDGDGDLDVVAGNSYQANRLYRYLPHLYHTAQGLVTSLEVDTETDNIPGVAFDVTQNLPVNTWVDYYLSNNGGLQWFKVTPGTGFVFPTSGNDLRWRTELHSLSPALTPRVEEITLDLLSDSDSDGVVDIIDNCTLVANTAQRDTDGDGYGNYCDPDFDNNLIVNASDLAFFKTRFFSSDPDADLTGDGVVNAADLAILKAMFFGAPGPSGLVP